MGDPVTDPVREAFKDGLLAASQQAQPFSYNVHTVWKNGPVRLHPGAERYYRQVGYLK